MSDVKRASLEELKSFANRVRRAGGGNPIDALLPAVPGDMSQCLIAKNLNFNCEVGSTGGGRWAMWTGEDAELASKIASRVGCTPIFEVDQIIDYSEDYNLDKYPMYGYPHTVKVKYGVQLPEEIGQVAADYDRAWERFTEAVWEQYYNLEDDEHSVVTLNEKRQPVRVDGKSFELPAVDFMDTELLELVQESAREVYSNVSIVNEDGSVVL